MLIALCFLVSKVNCYARSLLKKKFFMVYLIFLKKFCSIVDFKHLGKFLPLFKKITPCEKMCF